LYIAIRATSAVLEAHQRVLEVGGTPLYAGLDQHDYVPHVTVALGLTDENRQRILSATPTHPIPRRSWTVSNLALTRDENGTLLELSRVPLAAGRP
jgi:2'-5' RNA ligase